ncbi:MULTISPECIES: hypothetical protein [Pseudomonas aeruginosa group]|uniref:DUF3077 domain-containing protein n=1 Tax=Pseudomonas paraeruginosa TaxID=2994495 RepID=A0A2R3IP36_9PSED|nr:MULTISPECIES: hypothetical protein [Pseudomonas aeruginosa group]AVK03664.1 hypothetical protein CSB93_0902 [Pseudomonas paraeruginosa]AWE93432.1 hypothetical protein CSC28_6218 [Pseudomonas paraeruginosa]KSD65606.1 hypothetical protein AO903_26375 [Pseudomonas aeruginosa]MCT9630815.1 hypothetical protein [Pseudomonas aeruginosa]MCW8030614.1 hypothetical protein [Pseudomonas aeruginosa]
MAKPNDTSKPPVTEPSPRFIPLLPTSQANRFPRNATLYLDTQAPPGQLFESAKARLKSAINVLALTCLLDENEEPGDTLAYINGALLKLVSDALSEIEAAHPRQ